MNGLPGRVGIPMPQTVKNSAYQAESIEMSILLIRSQKVMFDADLSSL
jgi:hypothetical protein